MKPITREMNSAKVYISLNVQNVYINVYQKQSVNQSLITVRSIDFTIRDKRVAQQLELIIRRSVMETIFMKVNVTRCTHFSALQFFFFLPLFQWCNIFYRLRGHLYFRHACQGQHQLEKKLSIPIEPSFQCIIR